MIARELTEAIRSTLMQGANKAADHIYRNGLNSYTAQNTAVLASLGKITVTSEGVDLVITTTAGQQFAVRVETINK